MEPSIACFKRLSLLLIISGFIPGFKYSNIISRMITALLECQSTSSQHPYDRVRVPTAIVSKTINKAKSAGQEILKQMS